MALAPSYLAEYKARLKEGVLANKECRDTKFIPLQSVERIKMSATCFQQLEEALGDDGRDLRYTFNPGMPIVIANTTCQLTIDRLQLPYRYRIHQMDALIGS